jgi:MULE transposase domain
LYATHGIHVSRDQSRSVTKNPSLRGKAYDEIAELRKKITEYNGKGLFLVHKKQVNDMLTDKSAVVESGVVKSAAIGKTAECAASEVVKNAAIGSAAIGSAAIGSAVVGNTAIESTAIGKTAECAASGVVKNAAIGSAAIGSAAIGSAAIGSAVVGNTTKIPIDTANTMDQLINEVYDGATDSSTCITQAFEPHESAQIYQLTNLMRNASNFDNHRQALIAFAWVLPFEMKQFQLFPFVLHIDGTKCTNQEQRVLFTCTGRDSMGKQFIVLRGFLLNECAWMFKWLFTCVMPNLLGKAVLRRVRIVLTDGDSQETSQLDLAMKRFMPDAFRARCIWHIVDRGMMKNYPNGVSRKLNTKFEKDRCLSLRLLIRHWLWSWSQDTCESKEEFHLSAALFEEYLQSDEVKQIFDPHGARTAAAESEIEEITEFVRRNVEPLVPFFAFHLRKHMHTFETNSNSAHEGTNHGIKSHSAAVKPQHTTLDATD